MIPKEIKAGSLRFQSAISGWLLQVIETNWIGYWIFQLTNESETPLALLIDLDRLSAICKGLKLCIGAADDPDQHPRAKQMLQTVAAAVPTQFGSQGAVSILSEWRDTPFVTFTYYRGHGSPGPRTVHQTLCLEDAKKVFDYFATIYNEMPGKDSWHPQAGD